MNQLNENPKSQTYYEILGVSKEASCAEIESAYRRMALQYHPDKLKQANNNTIDSRFHSLNMIKSTLLDTAQREKYDETLLKISNLDLKEYENRLDRQRVKFEWKHGLSRSFKLFLKDSQQLILTLTHEDLTALQLPESELYFFGKKLPSVAVTRKKLNHILTKHIEANIELLEACE